MENREAVLSKVQKLYSLAGNNPSMEEAQSAMLKAQELLMMNGISKEEADKYVAEKNDPSLLDAIVDNVRVAKTTASIKNWHIDLAHAVCPNFRVEFLISSFRIPGKRNRGRTVRLIGQQRDVDACRETLEFAYRIVPNLWKAYWKEWKQDNPYSERYETECQKNSYMEGFCYGLKQLYAEQVKTKDLIVVTPKAVTERKDNLAHGSYYGSGSRGFGSTQSFNRGVADGKTFGNGKDKYIA